MNASVFWTGCDYSEEKIIVCYVYVNSHCDNNEDEMMNTVSYQ